MTTPVIDAATELPLIDTPDTPDWSENYCFDGFDPARDFGFWLHLGRWQRQLDIWREQVLLYLPGGDHLLMRAYGAGARADGPGGALQRFTCEEPGRRWRLRYEGPARRVTLDEMMAGSKNHITDGPYVFVRFDLLFEAAKPVWDMGDMAGENWASFHYEQHGKITGTVDYETAGGARRTIAVDGNGYRDHSRGVRDLTNFGGFYWNHAVFPSGRGFSVVHSYKWQDGARADGVSRAVVYEGDRILPAEVVSVPVLDGKALPPERYTLLLRSELGEMAIEGRPLRTVAQSSDRYNNQFDGIATPDIGVLFCFEQPTEYRWNGEIAPGWTERAERT
jgi:hypothetical protein